MRQLQFQTGVDGRYSLPSCPFMAWIGQLLRLFAIRSVLEPWTVPLRLSHSDLNKGRNTLCRDSVYIHDHFMGSYLLMFLKIQTCFVNPTSSSLSSYLEIPPPAESSHLYFKLLYVHGKGHRVMALERQAATDADAELLESR